MEPALFDTAFDKLLDDDGRVYVFTPNRDWIEQVENPDYIADATVVRHYNLTDLSNLFGSKCPSLVAMMWVARSNISFGTFCSGRSPK